MSGDVQPRKRKDKKRKKDDLGVEEPRGTAAVLGEGDVFMHSQHDHGTGGHWCAKIVFFSLLAVLIGLIGLIILENRGLSELEANAVESRYSGVLEGWIEDTTDDNHHDEHTLDLIHHDDDDNEIDQNKNDISNELDEESNNEDESSTEHNKELHNDPEDDDQEDDDGDQADDDDDQENDDDDQGDDDDDQGDDEDDQGNDDNDQRDIDDEQSDNDQDSAEDNDKELDDYHIDGNQNGSVEQEIGEDDDDYASSKDHEINNHNDINNKANKEQNWKDQKNSDEDKKVFSRENNKKDLHENYINNEYFDSEEGDDDEESVEQQQISSNQQENSEQIDEFIIDDQNNSDDVSLEHEKNIKNDRNFHNNDIGRITRNNENNEAVNVEDVDDPNVEIERIEKEFSDEELDAVSANTPVTVHTKEKRQDDSNENDSEEDDEDFLSPEDIEELPIVEHITASREKPLIELEDEASSEKPPNTLAEEEEYEIRQAELRREKEQASHMWLKIVVGGALLVATHAVIRRATAPRDTFPSEEHMIREETPTLIDRRMTWIPEEPSTVPLMDAEEIAQSVLMPDITEHISFSTNTTPVINQDKIEEKIEDVKDFIPVDLIKDNEEDKELYSDEDDEDIFAEKIEKPQQSPSVKDIQPVDAPESDPEDVSDDVEIIDDEQLEEELMDEEDEEEISDVDDAELLHRLEAKYGRLPEPERPGQKHKDGGNSVENEWPGEPSDAYWRQQLDQAEQDLRQGAWSAVAESAGAAALRTSGRARYVLARALDAAAEARRDNALLSQAIAAYLELLKMNERLSDKRLKEIADRAIDRIRFRGNYMGAEPVYKLLIRRFPDDPSHRNNLSINYLMANRNDLAEDVLKETLQRWPEDRVALAHLGFVLKDRHNQLEEAVELFQKALEGDIGPANQPRFYYHLGDALLQLGRNKEAIEVHERGAALGHFLSPMQRSLYNVDRLKSRPWWNVEETPYVKLARALESSWKEILKEGNAARSEYEKEKEGLRERGEWSQFDLFVRGREVPDRCSRAPVTCALVRQEPAAVGCRRGQIKFSMMKGGTHVRPHVGPTNCRLRMHLALSNTEHTYIRVGHETRQWHLGKVLMFDDSYEHEVWHNGTATRLVLIVDVWHPDLTTYERRNLPAI